mgnify:FL=1
MKSQNLYSWLISFWTNADTSKIVDMEYEGKKFRGGIFEWQMGGCTNNDKLPISNWLSTFKEILKYKKGFWSKFKTIWKMCISPLLSTTWKWDNFSNFKSSRPYNFTFNLLTMKIRQEMYESVGDQYGICGITRYRFQERFIWSDKWTDWKTFDCHDVDDHSPKTDEEFESYYDDVEGEYDYE